MSAAPQKRVLFVINTMGRGGAETALLELFRQFDPSRFSLDLYVMLGQGELIARLPENVRLLNRRYDPADVLSPQGKRRLYGHILARVLARGALLRNLPYILANFRAMRRAGRVWPEKLLWRAIAQGAPAPRESYDLAVAYLEGAAAYFVSGRVKARRKAVFIHTNYGEAGYTARLDGGAFDSVDRIFGVSGEVRDAFLEVHPECAGKTDVFHNIIDQEGIRRRAQEPGGFQEDWDGARIVTVGRLVSAKGLEVSVRAMALLKEQGVRARWYVLGEGEERPFLEEEIRRAGLEEDFLLLGVRDNALPYVRQADVYAHCSRYEGRSIAVQEAQTLGRPMVVSDCRGNREQVTDGVDGLMVPLDPAAIAGAVRRLLEDTALARRLGAAAAAKNLEEKDTAKLLSLLEGEEELGAT